MKNLPRAAYDTVVAGLVILTITASLVFNSWFAHNAVASSNHRWCATFNLILKHPVPKPPPRAPQARQDAYRFYLDFKELQHDFGCK